MKKFILFLFIIFTSVAFSYQPPSDKARGVFFAIGVGPRVPMFDFATRSMLGYGISIEISYTDNEYLPFFLYGKIGFEQFPGSQELYQSSDYSHFSANMLPLQAGARYYFPPILENIVIVIPFIESSASFTVIQNLHEFKQGTLKSNFLEDKNKFGFSIGAGVSMFLMEIVGNYNFIEDNHYLSMDIKVRLPLFVSL